MQTSILSRQHDHDHDHDHDAACPSCGHDHEHAPVRLWQTLSGVVLVANAFIVDWAFDKGQTVASASALRRAPSILGYPIVWTAIKDIYRGILSINELVAIAVLAAFASADYKTAGVVAFFMLMGEIIETRTAEGARASIESLIRFTPTKARRITPQGEEEVAATDLAVGDVIRIRPGDNVAADGVILSRPGLVQPGHHHRRITAGGQEAGRRGLRRHAEPDRGAGDQGEPRGHRHHAGPRARADPGGGKDQTADHEDRGPVHGLLHAAGAGHRRAGLGLHRQGAGLNNVISVIIFSCPCAFILATPTAMVAALSAAARLGILIKNVADIELAAKINAFVFDKTGTLTTGELAVSRLAPLGETKPAEFLRLAASAEKYSNHPTAKALAQLAAEAGVPLAEPKDFAETAGRGIKAEVNGSGVLVGRGQWLQRQRRDGRFPEVGGPQRNRGLEPDFCRPRRPVHRLGGLAGPNPRRGARGAGGIEGQRRAAHRDGFRRPPAGGHARGAGDRLRGGQGRVPAAEQGRVRARRQGQGLPRGRGGRRRERRPGAGRRRHRHRHGRRRQRGGHSQRHHRPDEQRPAPAAVPGQALPQHPHVSSTRTSCSASPSSSAA